MPMEKSERDIMLGLVRAEAAGQAKIYAKELAMQFNTLRDSDIVRYDTMAANINKLGVMVEVIKDLLCDPKPLESEGLVVNRKAKFDALCNQKLAAMGK